MDKEHEIPVKVVDRRWWVNQEDSAAGAGVPHNPSSTRALAQTIGASLIVVELMLRNSGLRRTESGALRRLPRYRAARAARDREDVDRVQLGQQRRPLVV